MAQSQIPVISQSHLRGGADGSALASACRLVHTGTPQASENPYRVLLAVRWEAIYTTRTTDNT